MDSKKIEIGALYWTNEAFGNVEVIKVYTDEQGREVCEVAICSRQWTDGYADGMGNRGRRILPTTSLLEKIARSR